MVIHVEFYETKQEAVKIEKFYKTGEGRRKIAEILEKYVEGSYPPKAWRTFESCPRYHKRITKVVLFWWFPLIFWP